MCSPGLADVCNIECATESGASAGCCNWACDINPACCGSFPAGGDDNTDCTNLLDQCMDEGICEPEPGDPPNFVPCLPPKNPYATPD
jgi:hypothetical protein